ncbi:AAA-domain-containing protein [Polychaeton citri CBS 116435]|uniref:AAA-domain-containing protein n=1 Tax=Polychaeton citri CBS 116435 TaxID=1314669 RepID=A0A9P4UKM2_9PEZI|nr:AAA-domain-containing protein [Polychaeton citri CBS 116435]
MAYRKRKLDEFDPNKSDSDDLDYDNRVVSSPRPQRRSQKQSKGGLARRAPKRRRRDGYGGSDDDVDAESEVDSEEDEFSLDNDSEEEEPKEVNPRTGRKVRSVAKKPVTYDESSDVDLEGSDDSDSPPPIASIKRSRETKSLLVTLPVGRVTMEGGRVKRSRAGSRTAPGRTSRGTTPDIRSGALGARRSSRISHSDEQPLVALTDSGKHELITRAGTATPEPEGSRRPIRGGKGLKKPPSAILEESQEDSQLPAAVMDDAFMSQLAEAAVTSDELQVKSSLGGSDAEKDAPAEDDDIQMEQVVQESEAEDDDDAPVVRGASTRSRARSARSPDDAADDALDPNELADEADDLRDYNREMKRPRKRQATRTENISFEPNLRSRGARPDYRVFRPELVAKDDDDEGAPLATATPQRGARRGGGVVGGGYRSLFSVSGPFGGGGGAPAILGGAQGPGAVGDVDSDSSDDEGQMRGGQQGIGGAVGMTPTSAVPKPYFPPQAQNTDPMQSAGGGALTGGVGKVKDKKALADADPLGVDTNVKFDGVGGLDDHIDRLKEMVALPLLYPEVFQRFHVTPPRGVLFHGPPGTGKTLLARALASSVSSHGKKVTFYMRKGADALSKWVGEAERQLRLLFEEARKNQPSIIFFDEIDGLAPVRSSKQEQIHASIVATLLALMDGMDGRGQVIVIGATNRPDSVDPALRRPGRFDREFYFPLPDQKARRAIIDIHTKGWDPPLQSPFKDHLAEMTRGYGGADLRALCTEAALNAVQSTYPQIYKSDKKLVIDPSTIRIKAKDFMISVNKIVPSSERSAASGAQPLKKELEALLRVPLKEVTERVNAVLPRKRKATALEEAMFEDETFDGGPDVSGGFDKENMQRAFESSRVFRPRLLIKGKPGMGQFYLGPALLSKLEGMHVQSFDLGTLMKDSTRSTEAAIVQQFEEVKRHKPSVIYIPSIEIWYRTLDRSAIRTFVGLLRSLNPTDPILVLGVMDNEEELDDDSARLVAQMKRELFGYSSNNQFEVPRLSKADRTEFFHPIMDYIRKNPTEYPPDPENRKLRELPELPVAQEAPVVPKGPTKAELQEQKKKDRLTLNLLKIAIQPVMDQIKKYKKFRFPVVQENIIAYLYDEQNPDVLTTDLNEEQRQQQQLFRPYELDKDEKGVGGLREVASGKFYYNLDIVTIENRLSNGYYKRTKDFLGDMKRIAKDAKMAEDPDRTLKANEMLANVEVDMAMISQRDPALHAECENVYQRELKREEERKEKAVQVAGEEGRDVPRLMPANVPPPGANSKTTTETGFSGPVMLGQEIPDARPQLYPTTPIQHHHYPGVSGRWGSGSGEGSGVSSRLTNGSTVPSRKDGQGDVEMTDSQQKQQHEQQHHIGSNGPSQQQHRSQKSFHTQLAYGSQPGEYHNSASTTTSGQKTSDRSSGAGARGNVQWSNSNSNGTRGERDGPNFSNLPPVVGGSQLPDTQEPWEPRPSQTQHPATTTVATTTTTNTAATSHHYILDAEFASSLHTQMAEQSSGLSVEQLEQVMATLMDVVWQARGEWNRNQVVSRVMQAFNDVVKDIEACQTVMGPSQQVR